MLNLVKNYQASNQKCNQTTFFEKCTTLVMVIVFPNKNNQKFAEEQAV